MKKLLVILMLTISGLTANAQRVDKPGAPYDYFCYVQTKDYIYGVIRFPEKEDSYYITDDEGYAIVFNSGLDILNYMSKRGWSFVHLITQDGELGYIIKKSVEADSDASNYINYGPKKVKKGKTFGEPDPVPSH